MTITVTDATAPLRVRITEADRTGTQCSPEHCVVANALHRQRGVLDQRIGACTARVLRRSGWVRYDLDPTSVAAIAAYDAAGIAPPAGLCVSLLPPRTPLGARRGERPGSNRRSGARTSVATRRPSLRHIFVEPAS